MTGNIKTFTVVMAQDAGRVQAPHPFAWLCFRLGENGLVQEAPVGRGGLMGIYCPPPAGPEAARKIDLREVTSLLRRGGMEGLLLDLSEDERGASVARELCPMLDRAGIRYYIPEPLAPFAKGGIYIIPSAVSGGSFSGMLEHFAAKHGSHRLALELIRTRHDFTMPSKEACGRPLSPSGLDRLTERCGGMSYYSQELCCRYFTYMDEGKVPHFVMFDDASTAIRKLEQAAELGITAAFSLWSDWGADIKTPYAK